MYIHDSNLPLFLHYRANDSGDLGQGTTSHSEPVKVNLKNNTDNPSVPICSSVTQLVTVARTTCVLCLDTQVRCWGKEVGLLF